MNTSRKLVREDIQRELLEMLKITDKFLRDNNIQYSIFAGTLLGAIRHKGFIPWDDDIDIALERSEYDKFLLLLRENNRLGDTLCVKGVELNNGDTPFIKIVNPNIVIEENLDGNINKDFLWIDVFPIDNIPNHFQKLFFLFIDKYLRKGYFFSRYVEHGWRITGADSVYSRIVLKIAKKNGSAYFAKRMSEFLRFGNKTKYIGNCIWGVGAKEMVPRKIFSDYTDYVFEDTLVRGISDADTWLKIRYGDYMVIPPVEKRINHQMRAWKNEE